jgi:hypothetical protein
VEQVVGRPSERSADQWEDDEGPELGEVVAAGEDGRTEAAGRVDRRVVDRDRRQVDAGERESCGHAAEARRVALARRAQHDEGQDRREQDLDDDHRTETER